MLLESDQLVQGVKSVQIADMQGRFMSVDSSRPAFNALRMNVSNLPTGDYLLRVETTQGLLTKRLVVAR